MTENPESNEDFIDRGDPVEAILQEAQPAEEHVNIYREAAADANAFYKRSAMEILRTGPQTYVFECWILAMGWPDLLEGVKTAVDLAKKWNVTRASVVKIVNRMQGSLDLPPMPGQRSEESREKFKGVREGQLKCEFCGKPKTKCDC